MISMKLDIDKKIKGFEIMTFNHKKSTMSPYLQN